MANTAIIVPLAASATRSGYIPFSETSGEFFWVFPASIDDEDIRDEIDALPGFSSTSYYRGPGQEFTESAHIHRAGSRVLVTQAYGLDV